MLEESAKQYFLVPLKEQESLFFIGDKDAFDALMIVMDAPVVATAGINTETCYVIVDLTNEQCEEVIHKASEIRARAVKEADGSKNIETN